MISKQSRIGKLVAAKEMFSLWWKRRASARRRTIPQQLALATAAMEPVTRAKARSWYLPCGTAEAVPFLPVSWTLLREFSAALVLIFCLTYCAISAVAQSSGNSSLSGVVADPTGAVVPGATVELHNPVSQFDRSTTTDSAGLFSFPNVPFNSYHLSVTVTGFAAYSQDVDVRSAVPLSLKITLQIAGSAENVTVQGEASDLLENDPTFHTDIDRSLFEKLPLESGSSELSSLVTLSSPGVAADSNGLFHGMGDHASNSFSLDGQPITDQQSKVFSNQIPLDAVQSMTVIGGAPPAEFGDKTSLVIDVTTRSGLGSTTPHGALTASYGTFGSSNVDFNFSYGGKNWGNFIAANGLDSGRFLDPPEFVVFHAHGNEENRVRSLRLPVVAGGRAALQFRLYALLVPDAEFLRQPELWRRGAGWKSGRDRPTSARRS